MSKKYRLNTIFDLQMGKTPARAKAEYWNDGSNDWVSIADMSTYSKYVGATKETITDIGVEESGIRSVPPNTVILSFKLSLGKVAITTGPVYTNEAIMAFLDKGITDIYSDYVYYLFTSMNWAKGTNKAVKGTTLNKASLGVFEISLPPLDEQRKIATLLDKAAEIIADRKRQLEQLDLLVKSRFVEMFGDPVTNPMGWKVRLLSEIILQANNGMARRGNDSDGSVVLRLVELQDGYIDYSNPNRISLSDAEKQRYLLADGDFLFARVNGNPEYVGRCAVFNDIEEPVYHNDHIIRVRLDDNVLNGVFSSQLLNSNYGKREMRDKIKTSAGQYTVSQDGIGKIKVITPPLPLQERFADFVQQTDKSKFEIQQGLKKLELQYNALMQRYFG
jgi:type I restriction enzyme S subunit